MKSRRVHIVICYNLTLKYSYISEVCSNKKKAQEHLDSISKIMEKYEPDMVRTYWITSEMVY
jgi:hypothetical protein